MSNQKENQMKNLFPLAVGCGLIGTVGIIAAVLLLGLGGQSTVPTSTAPPDEVPTAEGEAAPIESAPSSASTPIFTHMTLSKAPRLNEPALLTLVVTAAADAPNTTATITLPPQAVVMEGELSWTGDLTPQEPITLSVTIQFVEEGNMMLEGKALSPQPTGDVWGDASYLYLYITETAGYEGYATDGAPPRANMDDLTPPSVDPSS